MAPDDDDALQVRLAEALASADPVPDTVLAAARAAFTWRTIDEELAQLAELVADSAEAPLAGVRSAETDRHLTFEADGVEVEVLVTGTDAPRLVGQLVPPAEGTATVERPDGVRHELGVDRLGRFSTEALTPGPLRVAIHAGPHRLRTAWFNL